LFITHIVLPAWTEAKYPSSLEWSKMKIFSECFWLPVDSALPFNFVLH